MAPFTAIPVDEAVAFRAAETTSLAKEGQMLSLADVLIAATALANNLAPWYAVYDPRLEGTVITARHIKDAPAVGKVVRVKMGALWKIWSGLYSPFYLNVETLLKSLGRWTAFGIPADETTIQDLG